MRKNILAILLLAAIGGALIIKTRKTNQEQPQEETTPIKDKYKNNFCHRSTF